MILLGALFLQIFLGFPHLIENEPESESVKQDLSKISGADQKMEGVHLVESREGDRDWELFAEAAEGYQGHGTWELRKVKVLFYSEDQVQFTVTGDQGSIDSKSKDMSIRGQVQMISANGYRFNTDVCNYEATPRILKSPFAVKMVGPPDNKGKAMHLVGDRMETSIETSLMTIRDNVRATKAIVEGKDFVIRSGAAEFSSNSNLARFFEKVFIQVDTMKLEGPEAQFQYDRGTDFLSSVLVQGGVRVSDMDKYATSETVQFEPLRNQLVLKGRPRVVQNNDEITGDRIVFIDGGKKVKVENIRGRMEK